MFEGAENQCDFTLNTEVAGRKLLEHVQGKVPVIWLSEFICSNGLCDPMQDGVFLYRDYGHLSYEGAAYLTRRHDLSAKILSLAE